MKQFSVSDVKSANKIGVDGVLIGSWAPVESRIRRILDVGCGCGIISMMMAQRLPEAFITGIDVEINAVGEAIENVCNSHFSTRIRIENDSFESLISKIKSGYMEKYDMIVSNPPFYQCGVDSSCSSRMLARHAGSLSPEKLMEGARKCLSENGLLSFIAPYEYLDEYLQTAKVFDYRPVKICIVRGNPDVKPKRVMLCLRLLNSSGPLSDELILKSSPDSDIVIESLTIESSRGVYTQDYIELGRPFYLKF